MSNPPPVRARIARHAPTAAQLRDEARRYLVGAIGLASYATGRAGRRYGSAAAQPAATEIVAEYTRGWVLFGSEPGRPAPLRWETFPERAVITPDTAKVPRRLRSIQRREEREIRIGEDFAEILRQTGRMRTGWLTAEAIEAYRAVHALGLATTVGTYRDGRLVGGLWGLEVGRTLGIMSMFHRENHAGALALAAVADEVAASGRWTLVDCGQLNENFARYGAYAVPTARFCELVWQSVRVTDSSPATRTA